MTEDPTATETLLKRTFHSAADLAYPDVAATHAPAEPAPEASTPPASRASHPQRGRILTSVAALVVLVAGVVMTLVVDGPDAQTRLRSTSALQMHKVCRAVSNVPATSPQGFLGWLHQACDGASNHGGTAAVRAGSTVPALVCAYYAENLTTPEGPSTDCRVTTSGAIANPPAAGMATAANTQGRFAQDTPGAEVPASSDIQPTSAWTGSVNGQHVAVVVGDMIGSDQPADPALEIVTIRDSTINEKVLPLPQSARARVTGAHGSIVTLEAVGKVHYQFNLQTGQLTEVGR